MLGTLGYELFAINLCSSVFSERQVNFENSS